VCVSPWELKGKAFVVRDRLLLWVESLGKKQETGELEVRVRNYCSLAVCRPWGMRGGGVPCSRPTTALGGVPGNWPIRDILSLVFVCKNQTSLYYPRPFALPALLKYACATFCAIYDLPPTLPVDAIQYTILVRTTSCTG